MAYFKQHGIISAKLEGDKLIIEYNNSTSETKDINNSELEKIRTYCQKVGKSELSLSDLQGGGNNLSNNPSDKSNKALYIGLAVVGILAVVIIAYFLTRNKKSEQEKGRNKNKKK